MSTLGVTFHPVVVIGLGKNLLFKSVLAHCGNREKLLKFEAEGREFANNLRSLDQFIQKVKGQNNFW